MLISVVQQSDSVLCAQLLSRVQLFATSWTVAHRAPLSMGFFRQEYWSGVPFPIPGDLPDPGIETVSPVSPALAGRLFTTVPPGKPHSVIDTYIYEHILSNTCTCIYVFF